MSQPFDATLQQSIQLFQNGQLESAEHLLQDVLRRQPRHFDALHLLGIIKGMQSEFALSQKLLRKAVALNPNHPLAQYNLARALSHAGKDLDAMPHHRQATQLAPRNAEAWLNFGKSLEKLQQLDQALSCYETAIDIRPEYAEAWMNKGVTLYGQKRFEPALAALEQALTLRPAYATAWFNKGLALNALDQFEAAIAALDQAKCLDPARFESLSLLNKGIALSCLDRADEAITLFRQTLDSQDGLGQALASYHLGLRDFHDGDLQAAQTRLNRCLELKPGYAEALFVQGLIRLTQGDFKRGWKLYDYRWQRERSEVYLYPAVPSLKSLNHLHGKRILVWPEQGYGDTLQFCRYLPLLSALGADVSYQVPAPLSRLIGPAFPELCQVRSGEIPDAFDFQTPLLTLPFLFKTDLTSIPTRSPYLRGDPSDVAAWRNRLGLDVNRPNIGLCHAGNPKHPNDASRSMPLSAITPVLALANIYLVEKEVRAEDEAFLLQHPEIHVLGPDLQDFADTAAVMENLDLIISVDTAPAHLAGALGRPLFVLLPYVAEWRWMQQRTDSPWYPTARLFRQTRKGDWASVINEIVQALALGIGSGSD